LKQAGLRFEIRPSDWPEQALPGEAPAALAERLAREKALAVARTLGSGPHCCVVGADTIVVLGEAVLGKPVDVEHAVSLLSRLAGRRHRVITGVAVVDSTSLSVISCSVESVVEMRPADEFEIRAYVATGEPMDKAGAYALQGEGRKFVREVVGSETNVIGLPLAETLDLLRAIQRGSR
jgi:septum formation protein